MNKSPGFSKTRKQLRTDLKKALTGPKSPERDKEILHGNVSTEKNSPSQ